MTFNEPETTASSTAMPDISAERVHHRLGRFHKLLKPLKRTRLARGIYRDIRARLPYYWSDWKHGWNYRVLPATALIFFAKYAYPLIAQ